MKKIFYNNQKLWIFMLLTLATALCFIKFLNLKDGGAMTFMSMGVLWLIPYFFGFRKGLFACIIFSACKFAVTYFTGEYINYNFWCIILEYPVAFAGMSLGALLPPNRRSYAYIQDCKRIRKESQKLIDSEEESEYYEGSLTIDLLTQRQGDELSENSLLGLILGYVVGVVFILVIYVICAVLFYDKQENMTAIQNLFYSIVYDSSYLLFEGIFTVMAFLIPGVYDSIKFLKHVANNPIDTPSIYGF